MVLCPYATPLVYCDSEEYYAERHRIGLYMEGDPDLAGNDPLLYPGLGQAVSNQIELARNL
jgi:hypothetical protein